MQHHPHQGLRIAYTVVTMGPIFGVDWTSAFAETVSKNQAGASSALFSLPDIAAIPGGVAIKRGNEIVAGLGVGGAPGGGVAPAIANRPTPAVALNASR